MVSYEQNSTRESTLQVHDLDAEEALLGCLLLDMGENDIASLVFKKIETKDFFRDKHRWVFEACVRLFEQRIPLDMITVGHELKRGNLLEAIGGPHFLGYLISTVPTSLHAVYYAQIVHGTALMRRGEKDERKATRGYRGYQ